MATAQTEQVTCPRCNGRGEFRCYGHIWGGTCFQCEGTGTVTRRLKSVAQQAREAAQKEAAAAEQAAMIAKGNAIMERILALYEGHWQVKRARERFPQGDPTLLAVELFRIDNGLSNNASDEVMEQYL